MIGWFAEFYDILTLDYLMSKSFFKIKIGSIITFNGFIPESVRKTLVGFILEATAIFAL